MNSPRHQAKLEVRLAEAISRGLTVAAQSKDVIDAAVALNKTAKNFVAGRTAVADLGSRLNELDAAVRRASPELDKIYGPGPESAKVLLGRLATTLGDPSPDWVPQTTARLSADNPIQQRSDGSYFVPFGTTEQHWREARDYDHARSVPHKRSGTDAEYLSNARMAAEAAERRQGWREIAKALGIEYDQYDRRESNRVRSRMNRLIDKGRRLQR